MPIVKNNYPSIFKKFESQKLLLKDYDGFFMKCPGQDTRYWKEDAIFEIKCPNCGEMVEFFKDDVSRSCPKCGKHLSNPRMDFGCATYCPYAEQCLGTLPPELREKQRAVFKNRIEAAVFSRLKNQPQIIEMIKIRQNLAQKIVLEEGGKLPVVLAAVCLLELKNEAETLLKSIKVPQELLKEIIEAVSGSSETLEAAIVHDAYLLSIKTFGRKIKSDFKTLTGKKLAKTIDA